MYNEGYYSIQHKKAEQMKQFLTQQQTSGISSNNFQDSSYHFTNNSIQDYKESSINIQRSQNYEVEQLSSLVDQTNDKDDYLVQKEEFQPKVILQQQSTIQTQNSQMISVFSEKNVLALVTFLQDELQLTFIKIKDMKNLSFLYNEIKRFINEDTVIVVQKQVDFDFGKAVINMFGQGQVQSLQQGISLSQIIQSLNLPQIQIIDLISQIGRLQQTSLEMKIGLQALTPFIDEKIVFSLQTILMEAIQLEEMQFDVRLGESFLIDLDIINNNQRNKISLQSLIEPYFQLPLTKQYFRQQLFKPICDIRILMLRYNDLYLTSLMKKDEIQDIKKFLKLFNTFSTNIRHLQQYHTKSDIWTKFYKSLSSTIQIIVLFKHYCNETSDAFIPSYASQLSEQDDQCIQRLCDFIDQTLKLDNGQEVRVNQGVHQDLDKLRIVQSQLPVQNQHLQIKKDILIYELQQYLSQLDQTDMNFDVLAFSIVKISSLGFQLRVRFKVNISEDQFFDVVQQQLPDWRLTFQEEQDYYFRNGFTNSLNTKFGDIDNEVSLLESKILIEITKQILTQMAYLFSIQKLISMVDYNIGLVQLMQSQNLCIPVLTMNPTYNIIGGRHIILENIFMAAKQDSHQSFQHNDFNCSNDRTLILTGPNYSGKSVYIKQVCLIIFMAHVGLPVCATNASIGLTDSMFSLFSGEVFKEFSQRLNDIELVRLAKISKESTNRSLIIFDELGKNLKFELGSCIFSQTILYLINNSKLSEIDKKCNNTLNTQPLILAATHFHSVLKNDLKNQKGIQFGQMKVKISQQATSKNITFEYQIEFCNHLQGKSFALEVAKQILNDDVLYQRGNQILTNLINRLQIDDINQ